MLNIISLILLYPEWMSQVSLEGSTRELVTSAYRKKQQQQARNMYTINFSIKGFILNMKINKFHFFSSLQVTAVPIPGSSRSLHYYCPGADRLLSMNFLFTKHIHHLDGLSVCGSNTDSRSLWPSSCLNWVKYALVESASALLLGFEYMAFSGNPASPGITKLAIAKFSISFLPFSLEEHL